MATETSPGSSGGGGIPVPDPTGLMSAEQHLARARELMRVAEATIKKGCGLDWVWQYGPLITAHTDLAKEIDRQKAR